MHKLVADNGPCFAVSDQRRGLLAKVHIARKTLAMQDDDYRALLMRITPYSTAKRCNDNQLRDVLSEFERMGFRKGGAGKRRALGKSQTVRKARAMWISLYQLGAINDGSDAALEAFGKRQLRVDRLQWADERQGFRLIEALKAMAERHGWSQRLSSRIPVKQRVRILKDRLIGAQLARLAGAGLTVTGPLVEDRADWPDKRLERAAAELASMILALPGATALSPSDGWE
jgi:hypothetical protein